MPKLKNRSLNLKELLELVILAAKQAANFALARWYIMGFYNADRLMPKIQVAANLQHVAAIPNWKDLKTNKDAYVMFKNAVSGTESPVILHLDYSHGGPGGLTYRKLHQQLRCHLGLADKVSLRVCPDRPWYNYHVACITVPEHRCLPSTDVNCSQLFGTTLRFYTDVHLHDYPNAGYSFELT